MKNQINIDEHGLAKVWVILLLLGLLAGTGFGGFIIADQNAKVQLADRDDTIQVLRKKLETQTSPSPSGSPTAQAGNTPTSQSTSYSSANLGISVNVPPEWVGKWRYQENGNIGISTSSVTFVLINKETKYSEVVTLGKIPQDKYNDARASNQAVGNADNLLKEAGGFAYVMIFPDGSQGDFKDFTYAQATTAAKASFKASFKTL